MIDGSRCPLRRTDGFPLSCHKGGLSASPPECGFSRRTPGRSWPAFRRKWRQFPPKGGATSDRFFRGNLPKALRATIIAIFPPKAPRAATMSHESIFDEVARYGVVPVIAIESVEAALPLADALLEGGLPLAEITFRTAAAAEVIARLDPSSPQTAGRGRHACSAKRTSRPPRRPGPVSPLLQGSIRPWSELCGPDRAAVSSGRLHAQRDRAGPVRSAADSSSSSRPNPAAAWKWSRRWQRPTPIRGFASCRPAE